MAEYDTKKVMKGGIFGGIFGGIISLLLFTNILIFLFQTALWLAFNAIVIYALWRDAIKDAQALNAMTNKVKQDHKRLGLFFVFKEMAKPQIGSLQREQVKFSKVLQRAVKRSTGFVFFSIALTLVNLLPVVGHTFILFTCMSFLAKPELESLLEGAAVRDALYLDLFAVSGAIVIDQQGETLLFLGASNKWFRLNSK